MLPLYPGPYRTETLKSVVFLLRNNDANLFIINLYQSVQLNFVKLHGMSFVRLNIIKS